MHNEDIKHKILFFFMPKSIVFTKKEKQDNENVTLLKAVSPCFYWCSGHEFLTDHTENKYLIQHQIYFINGNNIEPAQIYQQWSKSKNDIRNGIYSFLEMWCDTTHEKILINPNSSSNAVSSQEIANLNSLNNIYNFSEFAQFVAKSIFDFKNSYIQQAKILNFDFIQKEFWKHVALNPKASEDIRKYLNINFNTESNLSIKKDKTIKNKSKNETRKKTKKRKNTTTS